MPTAAFNTISHNHFVPVIFPVYFSFEVKLLWKVLVVQVSTLTGMLKVGFLSSAFLEIKVTTPQDSLNGVIHSEVASRASFQRELFF